MEDLYLTSATGMLRIDRIKELNITHIINLVGGAALTNQQTWEENGIDYLS
jgi:hypothetical protein